MKINDILNNYKNFFLAEVEDNQGILDFFKSITMDTSSFSLRYDRGNNFFDFAKVQSDDTIIFVIKDDKNIIRGTASIALIPHMLNGKYEICAYLGDLRISNLLSPKIRILWKKCYSEIIQNFSTIEEFKGVKFLYSAILDENQNAMRSLLKNNDQIIYHHLTTYQTYNVLRPYPFIWCFPNKYQVVERPFEEVKTFLMMQNIESGLEADYSHEFERRLRNWKDLDQSSFLSVVDHQNKILAVVAPWKCNSKKLVIEKMSNKQVFLSKIFPLLGIKPFIEKESIQVLYLTHLTFKKDLILEDYQIIMKAILNHLFKGSRDFHVISFFTYPQYHIESLPFLIEKTKANFYQVMSKAQFEEKQFLNLGNHPPAFEIGLA